MTKFIGLVGYPLEHSVSPEFQQAALDYHQLDICYETWETKPEALKATVSKLRQPQNLGANVTAPYKEAVLPLVDEIDEWAGLVSAINTVAKRNNKLVGFNTDTHGFLRALHGEGRFRPRGKRVVILGAGGVAKAVSFALLKEEVVSLTIANRTFERAQSLVAALGNYADKAGLELELVAIPWQEAPLARMLSRCRLVVNCTVMGMKYGSEEGESPLTAHLIPEDSLVYDLVYNPPQTPLLTLAKGVGARTLGGLPMLVYQGAASFELWTGRQAPLDIMFKVATRSLNEKGEGKWKREK